MSMFAALCGRRAHALRSGIAALSLADGIAVAPAWTLDTYLNHDSAVAATVDNRVRAPGGARNGDFRLRDGASALPVAGNAVAADFAGRRDVHRVRQTERDARRARPLGQATREPHGADP